MPEIGQGHDSNIINVRSTDVPMDFTALGDPPSVSGHDPHLTSVSNHVSPQSVPSYRGSQNETVSMQGTSEEMPSLVGQNNSSNFHNQNGDVQMQFTAGESVSVCGHGQLTSNDVACPSVPLTSLFQLHSIPQNEQNSMQADVAPNNPITDPVVTTQPSLDPVVQNDPANVRLPATNTAPDPVDTSSMPRIPSPSTVPLGLQQANVAVANNGMHAVPNLTIRPQRELPFLGPFNREVTTPLIIANPASNCVLFKIKTTKPECYNVQPNIGRLGPMQKMRVEIMLKPQERDLAAERDLHQFLVEGMFAPSDLTDLESMRNLMRQTTDQKSKTTLQCDFRYSSPTSPLSDENNA